MPTTSLKPQLIKQLRWSCRRGMLELDLLLTRFLDQGFSELSVAEQEQFNLLLRCSDQDLFNWLMGAVQAPDPDLAKLIEKIRIHVQLSAKT